MAWPFSDTFTEGSNTVLTSHTLDSGEAWKKQADWTGAEPTVYASVNELGQAGADTNNNPYIVSTAPSSADYTVEVNIDVKTAANVTKQNGPVVRAVDSPTVRTLYTAWLRSDEVQLYRYVAGSASELEAYIIPGGLQDSTTYNVKLSVSGTGATVNLIVELDSTEVINYDDSHASRITATGFAGLTQGEKDEDAVITSFDASNTSAALTGTATSSITEADIRTGGKTVILTLTGDTFVTGTSSEDGIAAGGDSDLSGAGGWDNTIDGDLDNTHVVLSVGDTVATITLPATAGYDLVVAGNETITWTIPAASLTTSGDALIASPAFTIAPVAPTAAISGTVTAAFEEDDVVAGGDTIIITLTDGAFKAAGTGPIGSTADTQALIDNIDSGGVEANGWDAVVKAGLSPSDVTRDSSTQATVLLPDFGSYVITSDETITVTVPTDVLNVWDAAITGSPTFDVANTVAKTITLTDLTAERIYQRTKSTDNASITVTGTYTGAISTVEARIVEDGTDTEVVTWTALTGTPAGGNFSGAITVPSGGWYNVDVRMGNDTSKVSNGANAWGVGILVGCIGQSLSARWFTDGSGQTPNDTVRKYDGTWAALGAASNGATAFSDALQAGLTTSIPVGMLDYGVGASSITTWNETGDTNYDNFITGSDAVGGGLEFVLWSQGEKDIVDAMAEATYETHFATLTSSLRADITNKSDLANLPIVVSLVGKYTDQLDASANDIRNAQLDAIAAGTNVYRGATKTDLALVDTVHLSTTSFTTEGGRMAQCILFLLGEATYYLGPEIASYTTNTKLQTDVTITHAAGTTFTPTSSITGFEVTDAGVGETISAADRLDANTVRLTHGSVEGAKVVRYLYGADPVITSPVVDDTALTLPLLSEDSIASVTVTAATTGDITSAVPQDIVDGGKEIILTLTGDIWVDAGATFEGERQNIIDGLDSAQVEATGWNAEVRDKEVVGAVVRTSDTVVTITLTAQAGYLVTASETITPTIPASALFYGGEVTSNDFNVTVATAGSGGVSSVIMRKLVKKQREKRKKKEAQEVMDQDQDVRQAMIDLYGEE